MLRPKFTSLVPRVVVLGVLLTSILQARLAHAEPVDSQPAASHQLQGRRAVATVFGEKIYADELQPASTTSPASRPLSPDALSHYASQQLARKIISPLRQQFLEQNHLEPTVEELKRAADSIRQNNLNKDRERRTRLTEIEGRLKTEEINPREKEKLLREKQGIERVLDTSKQVEANDAANRQKAAAQRDALRRELESARADGSERADAQAQIRKLEASIKTLDWVAKDGPERMADWMVGPWIFNRALYRKYGGTVIWQQAGTEAVGAMRAWLEEHERAGHFKILDPDLREEFWRYYRREDHPFQVKKADPFERPPWEEELASRPG